MKRTCEGAPRRSLRCSILLPVLALALALLLGRQTVARAQENTILAATSPAPLAGTDTVTFISQAVDAQIRRDADGGYVVDARGSLRLHNTDRFNDAGITLGWPGWPGGDLQFNPALLPGFVPVKNEEPLPSDFQVLPTGWGSEERESTWLVATTEIARDTRERIFFDWSQSLGQGPLLTFAFGLQPAGAWQGSVGSARVTLSLPAFAGEEIVVAARPATYSFDGRHIEWLLVNEEPSVNPTVTIIAPHLWQEIEQARAGVTSDPVDANLRLVGLYDQLAAAGITRYVAEAEAALEAIRLAAPEQPEVLQRLAALYRSRAGQDGENLAALEQAAEVGEAALRLGIEDEGLREAVAADLETLANAWAGTDPAVALAFLARAEQVSLEPAPLTTRRQDFAEEVVLTTLARGSVGEALEVARAYGLPAEMARLPWLQSAVLWIETGPQERVLRLQATGEEAILEERLGGFASHLAASGYMAAWEDGVLVLRLRGGPEQWQRAGQIIAQALPTDPEWDLLRGALTPGEVVYATQEETVANSYDYRETLSIDSGAATMVDQLQAQASASGSRWEQALLAEAASRWQAFQDQQEVIVATRFEVGESVQREWRVSPPTAEVLEWSGTTPLRDRWLLGAAAAAAGLLLLLGLIWLPARRPRQRVRRTAP